MQMKPGLYKTSLQTSVGILELSILTVEAGPVCISELIQACASSPPPEASPTCPSIYVCRRRVLSESTRANQHSASASSQINITIQIALKWIAGNSSLSH